MLNLKRAKKNIWLLIFALLAYGFLAKELRIFPFYQLKAFKLSLEPDHDEWYYNRTGMFAKVEPGGFDLVMVGDSMVEGGRWAEWFPGVKVANRGISGDSTRGVMMRTKSITNTGAQSVVLMLGINDIFDDSDIEVIKKNYSQLIEHLLLMGNGSNIYIMSTLFVGKDDDRLNPQVKQLNTFLERLALLSKRLVYLNLNEKIASDDVLEEEYTSDGIHLNKAGYRVWRCMLVLKGVVHLQNPQGACSDD